jgi:multicomponent Na+:H+ antiporter subunit E
MILSVFALLLAIVWVVVTGSVSFLNLILGFLLAVIALAVVREPYSTPAGAAREPFSALTYLRRTWLLAGLALLFLYELAKAVWAVTRTVLQPRIRVRPGIFAFPLTVKRDFEITLLANLITLTPGTLSVDVSDDRRILYVHALDCSDPEANRRDIAEGFERRILEAFR